MEFTPFHQNSHLPDPGIPDGFALVPLQLFLLMAHQLPIPNGAMTFAAVAKPVALGTLYDRAMTCSAN